LHVAKIRARTFILLRGGKLKQKLSIKNKPPPESTGRGSSILKQRKEIISSLTN